MLPANYGFLIFNILNIKTLFKQIYFFYDIIHTF